MTKKRNGEVTKKDTEIVAPGPLSEEENGGRTPSKAVALGHSGGPIGSITMPTEVVTKVHVLLGIAIHAEVTRSQNDAWFGLSLAAIQDAFEDPAQKEQLRAAGYNSFKDIAQALPYDTSYLYKRAKVARSLQQRALFACYEVGITWHEQELLARVPEGDAAAARAVLENAGDLPPDEVKKQVTVLLDSYRDALKARKEAEAELAKAKEVRLQLHEDVRKAEDQRDEARELARRNEAAVNDIPVTLLEEKIAQLNTTCVDVANSLDKVRYDHPDGRNLRRLGGRVHQGFNTVMQAFDRAVGFEEWLPRSVLEGDAVAKELGILRARKDELDKTIARAAEEEGKSKNDDGT